MKGILLPAGVRPSPGAETSACNQRIAKNPPIITQSLLRLHRLQNHSKKPGIKPNQTKKALWKKPPHQPPPEQNKANDITKFLLSIMTAAPKNFQPSTSQPATPQPTSANIGDLRRTSVMTPNYRCRSSTAKIASDLSHIVSISG